jgi:predicted small secreted protein
VKVVLGVLLAVLVAGCATPDGTGRDVRVAQSNLYAEPVWYDWFGGVGEKPRRVFSIDDEQATLAVRFARNREAVYYSFRAQWLFPGGSVHLDAPARTRFGTHRELVTSLPIRGHPPARFPGQWTVRLLLHDRVLVEHRFEIRTPYDPSLERPWSM